MDIYQKTSFQELEAMQIHLLQEMFFKKRTQRSFQDTLSVFQIKTKYQKNKKNTLKSILPEQMGKDLMLQINPAKFIDRFPNLKKQQKELSAPKQNQQYVRRKPKLPQTQNFLKVEIKQFTTQQFKKALKLSLPQIKTQKTKYPSETKKFKLPVQQINFKHQINYNVNIKARSYCVLDIQKKQFLVKNNQHQRLQIASLTKIMTCYVVLEFCNRHNLSLFLQVRVSQQAGIMPGTSAELKAGDLLSMMLPSGNDASIAIGQHMGKLIYRYQHCKFNQIKTKLHNPIRYFINQMNRCAKHFKLYNTHFANTHGLSNPKNYSSAQDMAILSYVAMLNKTFSQIVRTPKQQLNIYNQRTGLTRQVNWYQRITRISSNKLLSKQGYKGIKTGNTPNAGACLSSCFKNYICIVINAQNRFKQSNDIIRISQQQETVIQYQNIKT